jgi:hypothetical protein
MNGSYAKFRQGLKPECFLELDGAAESRALSRQDYRILSSSSPARAGNLFISARHPVNVAQATTEIPRFARDDNS